MAEPTIGNIHEYSVSELAGALKRAIEDGFGFVRVRAEVGRVTRADSGHFYLDLKDDKAVLSSVIWKGNADRLKIRPEQGMEVVATGRVSTFPSQSRYQLVIDSLEPAGVGALMALFEERKRKLAAEGLFAAEKKRKLPFLPDVIGVVTSPSGAVIRDILHRLRERFARHVIVWPTVVQGKGAELKIAAAIDGFNALSKDGPVPRPDVLIVARGGGSLEDLWCFNEEIVARAAAASRIPLISAVGHETDTTLIDFVADRRAPTPTAAAEFAVPVRTELLADLLGKERRLIRAEARAFEARRTALTAASRGLGRPEDALGAIEQRFDYLRHRLGACVRARLDEATSRLLRVSGGFGRSILAAGHAERAARLRAAGDALKAAARRLLDRRWRDAASLRLTVGALIRLQADRRRDLSLLVDRLSAVSRRAAEASGARLDAAAKLLTALSYQNVLERGFVLVHAADGRLIRRAPEALAGAVVGLVFADGERSATINGERPPRARSRDNIKTEAKVGPQKSLFD
jgi:exodeoxyribonuclease VII large subunit